jgi:nitrogen fixation protein NifB
MAANSHPCYNTSAALNHRRIHLPVAPSCNIQCRFCNRKYDCINESRPGVTSAILSPLQALYYLEKVSEQTGPFTVAGIAGPGDPFSEADLTIETFGLIRRKFPDLTLCVASNGLMVYRYAERLSELNVNHVTITINAVEANIGAGIVSWVRFNKKMYRGAEAAQILIDQQLLAIKRLHELGITVKINTIVVPGVNDFHIEKIAETTSAIGADVINCIPIIPVAGSEFESFSKPDHELMQTVRWNASKHLTVVHHCARCRADAAGLLGKENSESVNSLLNQIASGPLNPTEYRPYVAVSTREGFLINEHLGHSEYFHVFTDAPDGLTLVERRKAPEPGSGIERWNKLATLLHDCKLLLVNQAGEVPKAVLAEAGIKVVITEGLIKEALSAVFSGKNPVSPVVHHGCNKGGGGCG